MPLPHNEFADKTCSAPAERSARMLEIVLQHVAKDRALDVLDLGCGTGSLVFVLAESMPSAMFVGLDVSAPNIRHAEGRLATLDAGKAARIRFERADYLTRPASAVDVLVSDGVLHLIPGDTRALFLKLAADVRSGGVLVIAMPYDCAYNYAFAMLRRALRLVRSRALDALIMRMGRMLHGREMDDEGLRERIPYMYIPPQRLAGRNLREAIAPSAGLRLIARHAMPSVSLSQLKHEVLVFQKAA
jgi:cyclopropane fatty-acyl-phospholipid synthase-like methyltransferase